MSRTKDTKSLTGLSEPLFSQMFFNIHYVIGTKLETGYNKDGFDRVKMKIVEFFEIEKIFK